MILAFIGFQGSGKTLSMSVLGSYVAKQFNRNLFSNYGLVGSSPVDYFDQVGEITSAVMCLDEFWLSMDSRAFKDNAFATYWIQQMRKKGMVLMYTTQGMDQVDKRLRNATDVIVFCDRKGPTITMTLIDNHFNRVLRSFTFDRAHRFYSLYDTSLVIEPLKLRSFGSAAPRYARAATR